MDGFQRQEFIEGGKLSSGLNHSCSVPNAELECLCDGFSIRRGLLCEIRDRAGDAKNSPNRAHRETHPVDGPPQQFDSVGFHCCELIEVSIVDFGVARDAPCALDFAGREHSQPHRFATWSLRLGLHRLPTNLADAHVEIDPVE